MSIYAIRRLFAVLAVAAAVSANAQQAQVSPSKGTPPVPPVNKPGAPAATPAPAPTVGPIPQTGGDAIAVVDFKTLNEIPEDSGVALADNLITSFITLRFKVIERGRLAALMAEQNLQSSDLVGDAQKAIEFGRLKGVDQLVLGTINKPGTVYNLSARIVDAESGEIKSSVRLRGESMDVLDGRLNDLAKALAGLIDPASLETLEVVPPPIAVAPPPRPAPSGDEDIFPIAPPVQVAGGEWSRSLDSAGREFWDLQLTSQGLVLRFAVVPPGTFAMGTTPPQLNSVMRDFGMPIDRVADETPATMITISEPFLMGVTEVTVAQFSAFVYDTGYLTEAELQGFSNVYLNGANAPANGVSWWNPGFEQNGDHPVTCVSYDDAQEFCRWMSARSGHRVRLPSEAEWEWTARGLTGFIFPWGNNLADGPHMANVADVNGQRVFGTPLVFMGDDSYAATSPVGTYPPTPTGFLDLGGNVWEWCQDWYGPYPGTPQIDWEGAPTGAQRVNRGGGWNSGPVALRAAFRRMNPVNWSVNTLGFRVVVDLPQQ